MKELQNVWNWSTAMDLSRIDKKQQNMNANRPTFVIEYVNKYTKETRKRMCLNGITCTGTHQVKTKVKEL